LKLALKPLGRVDIPQANIIILSSRKELPDAGFYPVISKLEVKGNYDENLEIFLKVKKNTQVETIKCGTIKNQTLPNERFLSHWVSNEISFTYFIQLISPADSKVVASMKSPQSIDDDSKDNKDVAPVGTRFTDTSPRLWRLKMSEGEKPVIEISKDIEDQGFIDNLIFLNSILPNVVLEIGGFLLANRAHLDDEGWFKDWKKFFEAMEINDFEEVGDEEDEITRWLNRLVDRYCVRFKSNLYNPLIEKLNSSNESMEDF
tara:strand:- start:2234 stop:3013 length:780 start_codon:yes stop_codon:yes gene_type:complete